MTIRLAVIGAGVMGADHARTVATQVPGATLQVVCDADLARAKDVAGATGAASTSNDPLAVIADKSVDAVLIASPDQTHGALTIAAIEAGKPVLCEKPLAPTSAECLAVIDAEVRGGKRLVQVGFMRRFDPAYCDMKAVLDSGTIGKPLMFHNFHRNVSVPDWFTSAMAITNSAPHEFDIARFILDTDYRNITVFQPASTNSAVAVRPVFMVMEMAGGPLVDVEINNNADYGYDVRGELVGDKGTVSLRAPLTSETSVAGNLATRYPEDWRPRFADAYRLQLQAFVRSIGDGKPVGASAWDGYQASLIAEAGVLSLARGNKITVTAIDKPSLY